MLKGGKAKVARADNKVGYANVAHAMALMVRDNNATNSTRPPDP